MHMALKLFCLDVVHHIWWKLDVDAYDVRNKMDGVKWMVFKGTILHL